MRQGLRVYDADTHVWPTAEQLAPYLSARVRELVPDLDERREEIRVGFAGEVREPPYQHNYRLAPAVAGWGGSAPRVLGEAEPRTQERRFQHFMGERFPTEGADGDAAIRTADMDTEGSDVHMMVPIGANGAENPEVEMEFIRAQHRWLADLCAKAPKRLKSLVVATSRSVSDSVAEIHRCAREGWVAGVQPYTPLDFPIDHPDLEPIFAAAAQENLPIVHHSFASGYPGYRDLWNSPFIGRSASHPWAAMRFVAAMCGSGVLDRFPELRFAILESGFGWLPFWASRLDDQMTYVGYVNESLRQRPSEYLTSGRFFCSIEMHEGPAMVQMVTELLGDHILMIGTDFPHAESRFPESVDRVLAWQESGIDQAVLAKMCWENPTRCFGEP
jgi:predicted TIM-barrel fold metal-dependent hydrolase